MSGVGRNRPASGNSRPGSNERNKSGEQGGRKGRHPHNERQESRGRPEASKKLVERGPRKEQTAKVGNGNAKIAKRPTRSNESGGGESHSILSMGRLKGEWMEIRLPDKLVGAPMSVISKYLPLPPKLIAKLMQNRGFSLQGPNLRLQLFPREGRDYPSDWMELNILYEDEFTLIVNKPAGIEVHPSEKGQRRTLAHAVAAYYELSNQDIRIRHIHRIDKDTTGPVLYAKNEFAHFQYDKAMREKTIERIYIALAEGYLEGNKGKIDKPIGQDRHHSTRRRVSDTGDPAVTHFEVAERLKDHTLVRLRLETGRTHQIRVHLSSINHPLAGDGMYGGKRGVISRQALHGERLIWSHPWTGDAQQVRAPLPDDFNQALIKLRRESFN
jgi:23S rRNA pseudouridine1911/1915/1917 synthase